MKKSVWNLSIVLLGTLGVGVGGHALANAAMPLLANLEKGEWTLTERGKATPHRRVCLGDPARLLQTEHRTGNCSQYVIENKADSVTVQYRCAGMGHGHTSVRRETNRLVQIETQGILQGQPFDRYLEARRTGNCRPN